MLSIRINRWTIAALAADGQWHLTKPGLRSRVDSFGWRILCGRFRTAGDQRHQGAGS